MEKAAPLHNQKVNYSFESYTPGQVQFIHSNCADIAFWNRGETTCYIGNVVELLPNDFITLNGNSGELDTTQYRYRFEGVGTSLLIVVKKNYIQ